MRFTIRDLFLVTVIVALALGWVLDHWRLTRKPDYEPPPSKVMRLR
jgi:hypothetical protein